MRARAVLGAVLIADNPTDHHIFLSAFTGERELHSTSAGIAARTPRGDVEIIEPVAFRDRFGVEVAAEGEGMTLAGLRLGVGDLDAAEACAAKSGVAFHRHLNALVIESGRGLRRNPDIRADRGLIRRPFARHGPVNPEQGQPREPHAPLPRPSSRAGSVKFGNALPLAVIAGPCALESRDHAFEMATALKEIATRLGIGLVYKTSFDKANRTSADGRARHRAETGAADLRGHSRTTRPAGADRRA